MPIQAAAGDPACAEQILLVLNGAAEALDFCVMDITKSRDSELLAKTRGATALPVRELPDGRILTPLHKTANQPIAQSQVP